MESSAEVSAQSPPEQIPAARSFLVRHRFLPWMVGFLAAGLLYFALGWALPFVIAVGLIVSLLGRTTGVLSGGAAEPQESKPSWPMPST